ncbi:MAG: 3-dehydroquinate synthase (EC [uncultured Campylobacterales bacterium]|uniref:3-dehydroquinate synthase n=1 Tax=uncultured Campylobacterales bacterium TaxID=352960 RepID=A0A6S6T8W8_9BACT|nr:MAG: 3-dehydroquinate synthase (EC [uncultured Campylobacterales bacterium]
MTIDINLNNSYKINIDDMSTLNEVVSKKIAIITNPLVSGLHLQSLLELLKNKDVYIITIADGEQYKNWNTVEFILERLFDHKLDRNSTLIAFGGGIVGDITGFVASIYLRGIDFVQVPTTLLSQVDSSVGGKTGFNNKFGKNLVGSFYQPKAVFCETEFLKTLDSRNFSAGIAEIIKIAVMFDKDFFEFLRTKDLKIKENLQYTIKRSVELKATVVAQDEKEKGLRAVLNYGHTFAHIIEQQTEYKKYLHGEAVAIGMCMANKLAIELGLLSPTDNDTITNVLKKYNLPITYKIEDENLFYEDFFMDKKTLENKIKFILPNSIGDNKIKNDIEKETIIKILKEYCI